MYFSDVKKELYPIRCKNNKKLEYWENNIWNSDIKKLQDILSKNIQTCYLLVNNFNNYNNNIDVFMKNQNYILGLSDNKYKDKLIKNLKIMIDKVFS